MKRETSIDAVAGLMILTMMMGHVMQESFLFSTWMYLPLHIVFFRMPWFFHKAGMFAREQNVKDCLMGGKKLLIPFLKYSVIGYLCYQAVQVLLFGKPLFDDFGADMLELVTESSTKGNKPMWFLATFFVVKMLDSLLGRKHAVLWAALAAASAFVMYRLNWTNFLLVPSALMGYFYFTCGHIFGRGEQSKQLLLFCAVVFVAIEVTSYPFIDMRTNTVGRGEYLVCIPTAIAGILLINALFKRVDGRLTKPLAWIGQNAMPFYVWHFIVLTVSTPIIRDVLGISYPNWQVVCNVAVLCMVMPGIAYAQKHLKWKTI